MHCHSQGAGQPWQTPTKQKRGRVVFTATCCFGEHKASFGARQATLALATSPLLEFLTASGWMGSVVPVSASALKKWFMAASKRQRCSPDVPRLQLLSPIDD